MCFDCTLNHPVMLNTEISYKEITDAIKSLATNKSPGTDMLQIEFFKCSTDIVVPFFEKLFNNILNSGIYPSMWCEAILCPIYKQGDKSVEKNYRGISLLNSMSKIFTKIMLDTYVDSLSGSM